MIKTKLNIEQKYTIKNSSDIIIMKKCRICLEQAIAFHPSNGKLRYCIDHVALLKNTPEAQIQTIQLKKVKGKYSSDLEKINQAKNEIY